MSAVDQNTDASVVRGAPKIPSVDSVPIARRAVGSRIPATSIQRRIWSHVTSNPNQPPWTWCADASRITGRLDVQSLRRSLDATLRRHEALRIRFVLVNGELEQRVDIGDAIRFDIVDLSGEHTEDCTNRAQILIKEFLTQRVGYSNSPLFEARLLRLSELEHLLVIKTDHLVTDGISNRIIREEIWTLYQQAVAGLRFSLPKLPIQFPDYAVWLEHTHEEWMTNHADYWKRHLPAEANVHFEFSDKLEKQTLTTSSRFNMAFGEVLSGQLREAASHGHTTLALVVLVGYLVYMTRLCARSDLVVIVNVSGRFRPELQRIVGFMTGRLYLRVEVLPDDSFSTLLQKVTREFDSAYEHFDFDRVPFLIPGCNTDLFFNWMPGADNYSQLVGRCTGLAPINVEPYAATPIPPYKFGVDFHEIDGLVDVDVGYREDFISQCTAHRFGCDLLSIMQRLVLDPNMHIVSVLATLN